MAGELNLGNLYEINQQLMAKEPIMDPIMLSRELTDIAENMSVNWVYGMLLCKERADYTIFHIPDSGFPQKVKKELEITIKNRGNVLSIEKQNDNTYEIWIRDYDNPEENVIYMLFKYDDAVVRC